MLLRYRPMQPQDVAPCVDIVSANPILRARYGRAISDLESIWRGLLGSEAFTAVVFEELLGGDCRLVGPGVSVFVSDSFVRKIKIPPLIWIGPEMVKRMTSGDRPVLSDRELRAANTRGGLNLIGWHATTGEEDGKRIEVLNFMFSCFLDLHRGFLIKELLGQADSAEIVRGMANSGNRYFDSERQQFVDSLPASAEEIFGKPHIMGSTRHMIYPGAWGSSIFSYQPPRFGFRRSEQRLLTAALRGGTDEELSEELNVSLSSVRRRWLSIYNRVCGCTPELFREDRNDDRTSGRGKGKKNRLLAYLRQHPEELRPLSRKLLANGGFAQRNR